MPPNILRYSYRILAKVNSHSLARCIDTIMPFCKFQDLFASALSPNDLRAFCKIMCLTIAAILTARLLFS
jgi:hypothetical protein